MSDYTQYKTAAGFVDAAIRTAAEGANALGNLGILGASYVLAAAAGTGVGLGYMGAKLTAHGKQDIDTIKKVYQNDRLKADLGYLSSQVKSEYQKFKDKQAPKPARIIA